MQYCVQCWTDGHRFWTEARPCRPRHIRSKCNHEHASGHNAMKCNREYEAWEHIRMKCNYMQLPWSLGACELIRSSLFFWTHKNVVQQLAYPVALNPNAWVNRGWRAPEPHLAPESESELHFAKGYIPPRWKVAERDQTAMTDRVLTYRVFSAVAACGNVRANRE